MRKTLLILTLMMAICMIAMAGVHRVGTYNIRDSNMSSDSLAKAWDERKQAVVTMIRDTMRYDILALQETNGTQKNYLASQLGSIYTILSGPYSGNRLLYRTSKYNCLDQGSFYLAPDVTQPGAAWDAQQTRFTVWAKLQDKVSGEIIFFGATHLDLYPKSIREGARVNAEQMLKIAGDYPCIITGDMNSEPVNRDPHANYGLYFGNARQMCKTTPQGSYTTFASGMSPTTEKQRLLDYLYVRNVEIESYFVSNSTVGRKLMPSDHMPVVCEITIPSRLRPTTHVVSSVDELRQAARMLQPEDIIYLNDGIYDLGDSTLNITNTCVMEGGNQVVITGSTQLITCNPYISLEIRGLHFADASCSKGVFGSIVSCEGNYLKFSDCVFSRCHTVGAGLIYVNSCNLTLDHCIFRDNEAPNNVGCIYVKNTNQSNISHPLTLTNSTFQRNKSYLTPALYYASSYTAYLANNSFIGNQSSERGCVTIDATDNTTDIRLVNNTFADNRICTEAGLLDARVGGSAIWQNMADKGCLTLVHNTIVGNYTASWMESGECSPKFISGAVHSAKGQLKIYNNIMAGNYSSCAGRGDLSLATGQQVTAGTKNIFSSLDNTNYEVAIGNLVANSYTEACQSLVDLLGGWVEDSIYHPDIQIYGEQQDVLALSPKISLYAGSQITFVNATARSASTIGSDILNQGAVSGTLTTDQSGQTRSANSVPGAMELGVQPTPINQPSADPSSERAVKQFQNGQLYILRSGYRYSAQGMLITNTNH